jgi:hypothetical protein
LLHKPFLKVCLGLLCSMLFFQSCKYDLGNASWDTDLVAPLATGRLRLRNIIPDSLLTTNADGSLRFVYERDLVGLPLDSLLRLPDTPIVKSLSVPFDYSPVPPGLDFSQLPNIETLLNTSTKLNLKDAKVTYLRVKSGKIQVKVTNKLPTVIVMSFSLPKATKNGVAFQVFKDIPAAPSGGSSSFDTLIDLAAYEVDMKGLQGTSYNTFITYFTAKTNPNGPGVALLANQEFLKIETTLLDLIPDYAKGYMGSQHTAIGPEEKAVEPLSKLVFGSLLLDSIKMNLDLKNGVGADAKINIYQLEGRNAYTGNVVALNHLIIGNPINVTRAQDLFIGSNPSVYSYTINASNSNLKGFIENLPGYFKYHVDVWLNPLGNVSSGNDFIYYNSDISAKLKIELPLNFNVNNLAMVDTLDFNLSSDLIDHFKGGALKVYAINGFPLEAQAQLTLLDENFAPLDSLLSPNTLAAAQLGSDLKVVQKANSWLNFPVSAAKAEFVKRAKYVKLKLRFHSPIPNQLIKLYDSYDIEVKIIADITYEI